MDIFEAVGTVLRKYATFSGRASRAEFWWFTAFCLFTSLVLSILDWALFGGRREELGFWSAPLSGLFSLAVLVPSISATFRRLHDTSRPGWMTFLPYALIVLTGLGVLFGVLGIEALRTGELPPEGQLFGSAATFLVIGFVVTGLVAFVSFWLMIYWLTRPSEPGPNRYGPEPR